MLQRRPNYSPARTTTTTSSDGLRRRTACAGDLNILGGRRLAFGVIEPCEECEPLRLQLDAPARSTARIFFLFAQEHIEHCLEQVALLKRFFPSLKELGPLLVSQRTLFKLAGERLARETAQFQFCSEKLNTKLA